MPGHIISATKKANTILLLSVGVAVFWLMGSLLNVYSIPVIGAIFEMAWLPAVILTVLLPIMVLTFWIKQGFRYKSPYFYSILIIVAAILIRLIFS